MPLKTKLIILLITFIALALRVYYIEQKNLWFDEVYSWHISQGSVEQIIIETSGDIHPPLFYIILKFWITLFSDNVFSMRMLSVLLSILSIYLIYKISLMFLKNQYQIILVILLYAFSPLNIYYSQEIRMLNLNLFLCLGSVYYFFKFIKSPIKKFGIPYVIFTILALYTHYFAFLFLLTQIFIVIIFYFNSMMELQTLKKYSIYFLFINLLYIPWYPTFIMQTSKGQSWRTEQTFSQVGINVLDFFIDIFLSFYTGFDNIVIYYFSNFLSLFLIAFLIFSLFKLLNSKAFFSDELNSITFFFFIPLFIAIIISFNQSIVLSRYLSVAIPYLLITLVYFSFKIYKTKFAVIIILFLFGVSCLGTYINFQNNFKYNDYRKIISYLENNFNKEDEIVVEPHFMGWSIDYYIKHNKSNLSTPKVLGWNLDMQIDSLKQKLNMKNVWFISDYSSIDTNNFDSLSNIMNRIGFNKIYSKSFYIIPAKVRVEYYKRNEL